MKYLYIILFLCLCELVYSQNDIIITRNDTVYARITSVTPEKINVEIQKKGNRISSHINRENVVDYKFDKIETLKSGFDSSATYTIVTLDKTEFIGTVETIWHDSIRFKTQYLGTINIRAEHIRKISGDNYFVSKTGDVWFPNPNATRYYFGPTAYNLEKGEGYYQNVYALINMVNVGITNYISIGAGLEFVSTFSGSPTVFITPKLGVPVGEKFGFGTGIIAGIVGGEETAGILYAIGTYGSKEHNFTAGFGYGFISDEFSKSPIFTFSGMARVGRKVSLVSENWFIPMDGKYYGFVSYGIRLFGPKMSFDLALINNGDIAGFIPVGFPYIDYVIKF